jgi:hypothetical protein
MPPRVKQHLHLLRVLHKADRKLRESLIRNADAKLVHCLCECAHNTLRGNIPISSHQKKKLSTHKVILRKLTNKKASVKQKKKLLLQKGGAFLPLLLAPIIGALINKLLPS